MKFKKNQKCEIRTKSAYLNQKYNGLKKEVYIVEGLWNELNNGKTWKQTADEGNIASFLYAQRVKIEGLLPDNNKVYYGHICGMGELVHESELVWSFKNAVNGRKDDAE